MDQEHNIKVSVLVPVYNVEKYIEQCIKSIVSQSLKEIEIICINDGSTDNSVHILEDYKAKDSRIRIINKKNAGYGHSMNIGIDMAAGEYISIIESDDFAEPDMLEALYKTAVKYGADIVKGEYFNYRDGKDTFAGRLSNYEKDKLMSVLDTPTILYVADTIWSALYNRRFLDKNNIVFHETRGASFQDISFAIQGWMHASKVVFIDKPLLHYRRDNLSSSMHNPEKIFNVFDEYEWLEEKIKKNWGMAPEVEKYFVATKYGDYLNHYYRVGHLYQYALLLKIRDSLENDLQKCRIESVAFPQHVWESIKSIISDINLFYKRTSKRYEDSRLELCDIKNKDVYLEAFFSRIMEYPQIVVYGAGKVGRMFADALETKGRRPDFFTVTDNADIQEEYYGIPIKAIDFLQSLAESCAIIIAVTEANQYELYCNTQCYGFKNVYRVDAEIIRYCHKLRDIKRNVE